MTLLSKRAYMEKYHIGLESLNKMIATGEVILQGKKIVDERESDLVPRELYELELKKRIEAETKLKNIKMIIGG